MTGICDRGPTRHLSQCWQSSEFILARSKFKTIQSDHFILQFNVQRGPKSIELKKRRDRKRRGEKLGPFSNFSQCFSTGAGPRFLLNEFSLLFNLNQPCPGTASLPHFHGRVVCSSPTCRVAEHRHIAVPALLKGAARR